MREILNIDCGESVNPQRTHVDMQSSALDNVARVQRGDIKPPVNLSDIALYAECPVAKARKRKMVHIDLLPNMKEEGDNPDLSALTIENAKARILETTVFICRPFNAKCPKGFK